MRELLLLLFVSLFVSSIFPQTGYSFLSRIPPPPTDACSMTMLQRQQYLDQVNDLLREISEVTSKKKNEIEADVKNSKKEIEKNFAKEYGLSDSDVQKLKNKKLSKEEKKKIADQMMQDKTGISMKEIENLKKMSKEGKNQWAESYSTQQMANLSGNPDSNKTEEQLKMEKDLVKNKKMVELTKEQKTLMDRIAASDKKYFNRMMELEKEDSIATKVLNDQKKPLIKRLNDTPGPTEEEADQIWLEILEYEKMYCSKLTPIFINILGDAKIDLHRFMPDFERLQEINAELNKTIMGEKHEFTSPGLMQMEAVHSFTSQLLLVFKYANFSYWPDSDSGI